MGASAVMRCAIVGIGLMLVIASFWFHAEEKMNSDLAAVWCVLGFAVILVGAVPVLSKWLDAISMWTGVALLCVGAACLLGAFRICLMISKLVTQNQELAMMVSLMLAERRRDGEGEPAGEAETEACEIDEESAVCH